VAGVTREVRSAQERLPDRISIGVLSRTFPPALLDEVIEAAGVREQRYRRLPARLMMVFTLACWLFMRSGYGLVLSKLADAQAFTGPGWGDWQTPGTGAITRAKAKLGAQPFKLLFARTTAPTGTPDTPGVFHAGLRVVTVDGFTLDVPDTADNADFFGRGGNGSATSNPYPQLRALVLAESGTRVLLGAEFCLGPGDRARPGRLPIPPARTGERLSIGQLGQHQPVPGPHEQPARQREDHHQPGR